MKLTGYETMHCDAGWRVFSFLKLTTDDGLTGISEYNACYGSPGLSGVIERLAEVIVGCNPCAHEHVSQRLYAMTRQAPGGINQQAIAAIENAMLDLKAKALGVPVYDLLGGALRDRLPLYWSHCGTYRMSAHLCAAIPNFRIMEIDIDDVPWKDDILTYVPEIENGALKVPSAPGWGAELNEDVIRAHPPKIPV